ncbi:MAG: zinc ribbon domain-containing protein [Bacillota bacterium]|nr:zinc ribbon domain-containing protein [Bacillota bacterium]
MPTYKKNCMYCEKLISGDANSCPFCGRSDPFALRCPKCRMEIGKDYAACPGCGFPLSVKCPKCGTMVFPTSICSNCGGSLTVTCPNKKCGEVQPFINEKCVRCGKRIK